MTDRNPTDTENHQPGAFVVSDDTKLVTVAERSKEYEAAMLVAILSDAGIKAVATGGFTAGFIAEAPGWVRVQTFESDAERARQVIAEIKPVDPRIM